MNRKDSLAILGLLCSSFGGMTFYKGNDKHGSVETLYERMEFTDEILEYLRSLKLSYAFVRDIITDDYGSVFYHAEWGYNSDQLPNNYDKSKLCTSEHDGQIWFDDNGRLGVWCEVDGFVAWLDEYEKVWIVDTREEVEKRRRESEERVKKFFTPLIKKAFEKFYSEDNPLTSSVKFTTGHNTVKIAKIKTNGLSDYKRGDK